MPALAAILLLTIGGGVVAVDLTRAYAMKERLQTAADAAALAAAFHLPDVDKARQAAMHLAAKNVPGHGQIVGEDAIEIGRWDPVSRTVRSGGASPNAVRVTARLSTNKSNGLKTIFAGVFGRHFIDIAASAAAGKLGAACLVALNPQGKGLKLDKDARLDLVGCGAQSNATSTTSLEVKGKSQLTAIGICASGGVKVANPSAVSPEPHEYCPPLLNPMADFRPPAIGGCTYDKVAIKDQEATISPGVYCGGLKLDGTSRITMEPGLYVIDDGKLDLKGDAVLLGEGVTILLHGQKAEFDIGGSAVMRLSAPTTGTMKGLLIVQDQGDLKKDNKWDSDMASHLTGVVYLPDGKFTSLLTSYLTTTDACFVLLASEIVLSGEAKMSIDLSTEACLHGLPASVTGRIAMLE